MSANKHSDATGLREIDPELQEVDATLREVMLALENLERQESIGSGRRRR